MKVITGGLGLVFGVGLGVGLPGLWFRSRPPFMKVLQRIKIRLKLHVGLGEGF